jgi:hypothetical protein
MTSRWSQTQHLAAEWFRQHGWPFAEPVGNGRQGKDITGMPGLAPEVKAVKDGRRPEAMLRQAAGHEPACIPFVVYRPPGSGPAHVGEWVMMLRLEDGTRLLREAGYGGQQHWELTGD